MTRIKIPHDGSYIPKRREILERYRERTAWEVALFDVYLLMANRDTQMCYLTLDWLEECLGWSRPTIIKARKGLIKCGWIVPQSKTGVLIPKLKQQEEKAEEELLSKLITKLSDPTFYEKNSLITKLLGPKYPVQNSKRSKLFGKRSKLFGKRSKPILKKEYVKQQLITTNTTKSINNILSITHLRKVVVVKIQKIFKEHKTKPPSRKILNELYQKEQTRLKKTITREDLIRIEEEMIRYALRTNFRAEKPIGFYIHALTKKWELSPSEEEKREEHKRKVKEGEEELKKKHEKMEKERMKPEVARTKIRELIASLGSKIGGKSGRNL